MTSLFMFKNKFITRDGKPVVRNDLITGYNSAAIGGYAKWNGGYNFTSVGTNGRSSYYGTYDQTGNCFEWIDVNNSTKAIRGGDIYGLGSQAGGYEATKNTRYEKKPSGGATNPVPFVSYPRNYAGGPGHKDWGGRIASSGNPLNLSNYVTVGDANNSADTTGYGAVSYSYQINKYLLTNDEYCAFLNAVDTTPTTTNSKDIAYGISNDNIIYEINITDQTTTPVFYTNLNKDQIPTNALSFDTDNKYLFFLDWDNNLYSWDLGSTMTMVGNINTIGSLGIPARVTYGANYAIACASYYNGAIWLFNSAPGYTTQLVKINLSYATGKPTISSINKYSTNISNNPNTFGDIAIDNNGILYASTVDTPLQLYSLDVNNPSNSYTIIKNPLTPQFPSSGFQMVFDRNYNTLYLHDYGNGAWYTVNKNNGNMSSRFWTTEVGPLIVPWGLTGQGFRDLCGPHNIILSQINGRRMAHSPQMSSERVGGIVKTFNRNTNSFSYSVKSNYGNKPVYFLSWFDLARYCNWLHNNYGSLETGAYTLNNISSGSIITKNSGAKYYIPSENEWYKAAYYKGGGTNAGYWKFATRSDTTPTEVYASSKGDGTVKLTNLYPSSSGNTSVMSIISDVSITGIYDTVQDVSLSLYFSSIDDNGTIKISPIPAYNRPLLPSGYYLSNNIAHYNISTNSVYSGATTVCFSLPSSVSSGDLSNTKIFHVTDSTTCGTDITITSGINSLDYSTNTICASVQSLGDFYSIIKEIPLSTGNIPTDPEVTGSYTPPTVFSPTGVPSIVSLVNNTASVTLPSSTNTDAAIIRVTAYASGNNDCIISEIFNIEDPNPPVIDVTSLTTDYVFQIFEKIPNVGVSPPSPPSPYTYSPVAQNIEESIVISWE